MSKTATAGTLDMVQASGAKIFRAPVGMPNSTTDTLFQLAAERGITILPDITGIPGEGNTRIPPIKPGQPARARWEDELEKVVERYGPNGSFWAAHELPPVEPEVWEIWNEPNYGANGDPHGHINPERYGELLAISHAVITGLKPSARILFGGLLAVARKAQSTEDSSMVFAHMTVGEFIKKAGHREAYDALSLHPYAFRGVGRDPTPTDEEDVQHVTQVVKRNLRIARGALDREGGEGKKIWITELGWPVKQHYLAEEDHHHLLVSEDMQRDLLNSTFNMIKRYSGSTEGSFDIENVFYYNAEGFVNGSLTPRSWEYHCGLREDTGGGEHGHYREAWTAFQNQAN